MINADLYKFHKELNAMQKHSVVYHLLRGRIKEFYSNNGARIEVLVTKLTMMQDRYFIVKDDVVQTDGDGKPLMKEGMIYEEYEKEYEILMRKEVDIIF